MKLNPIVWSISLLFLILFLSLFPSATYGVDYKRERELLVKRHIIGREIKDPETIRSMLTVPREEFVPNDLRRYAYDNTPLPIGYGQTISAPDIVALMTQLLEVDADDWVLEIGTGSGYQAAILSLIAEKVYTIEIIEPLGLSARVRIENLGYRNIQVKIGDGYWGWEENAPFDAIIVTAAADHIPPPLLEQLKPGGRMCIPIGQPYFPQVLKLVRKDLDGKLTVRDILPVRFVPFTRADEE
jgi:protein-L-isoaspartate(D-aspartate) O-methyltransferase